MHKAREYFEWIFQELRWFGIRCLHVLTKKYYVSEKKYGKNILLSIEEGNNKIAELIQSGKPFAIGRESYVEMNIAIKAWTKGLFGFDSFWIMDAESLEIFDYKDGGAPKYDGALRFADLKRKAMTNMDMICVWTNLPMGDAYINTLPNCNNKLYSYARCLEPYFFDNPWTLTLKGKKVLVVSPFDREIREQYERNRVNIWGDKELLPEFDLHTVKSVFYNKNDGRFHDWFEALDYFDSMIVKEDFDVALLSCGPFGLPLADRIKQRGKQAIHIGGALQLFFGIRGNRWDTQFAEMGFFNEYWIRPGSDTMPENADKLDNKCYW